MTSSVVEYENLMMSSFSEANTAISSGIRPRWERKQMKAKAAVVSTTRECCVSADIVRQPLGNNNRLHSSRGRGDRFIPNRAAMDMEKSAHSLRSSSIEESDTAMDSQCDAASECRSVSWAHEEEYRSVLSAAVLGVEDSSASHRILSFKEKAPAPRGDTVNNLRILYSSSGSSIRSNSSKLVHRHIPSAPSRVLDAPDMLDDYYLNLISWSDTNILAVALAQQVYLWNASTGSIEELCSFDTSPDSYVSSVSWVQKGGSHLAVGTSAGTTQLWDVQTCKQLRSMDGHSDRVGALSWNRHILSSAGRDGNVVNHDVRVARHNMATLSGHTQEICGLSWNPDGTTLASGANDNTVCLWDTMATSSSMPRFLLTDHQSAVKALAWSPHERNLLATGGGTSDRTIKFWNSQTGALLNSIDTGSQVSALLWNPNEKEILSSHGYAQNHLCLWKYPSMAKVKELEGHTARVLHMSAGPDGESVVSAAADETLRFWNVFSSCSSKLTGKQTYESQDSAESKLSRPMNIR